MTTPRRIIIDTDPGQDDAVAILLAIALPELFEIVAITCVAGNVPVAQTTINALRIIELGGRPDIGVHCGCDAPMVLPLQTAEMVCGPDGLDGCGLGPPEGAPAGTHAVAQIIAMLRAEAKGGITICALGPLTNIAMALRLAPEIAEAISEIVVMGGSMHLGNITPAAEFNFHTDPHAAAVVFGAGIRVTLIGLHLTLQAVASAAHVQRLVAMGNRTGASVHGMLTRPRASGFGSDRHPMHDVCVLGFLAWPELFTGKDCYVEIDTSSGIHRGRSTIDWNGRLRQPANAYVLDGIDVRPFFDNVVASLSLLP